MDPKVDPSTHEQWEGDHGPTLRDLLDVGSLRLEALPGHDHGLDTHVRWAHSTELPDPSEYLRGGELVCTVGTTLTDPERCWAFVRSLISSHAAGICFGVGDVHDSVPPTLVDACKDLHLPLVLAPLGAPFSAISEYLAGQRVEAEASVTRTAEVLMPRLLASLRAHEPVSTLLDHAAQLMGGQLELRLNDQMLAVAGTNDSTDDARQLATRILGNGELLWKGEQHRPDPRLLEQLSRVVEVALGERDLEAALRRERIGQLLLLVQERLLNPAALTEALDDTGLGHDSLVVSAWPGGAAVLLAGSMPGALIGEAPGVSLVVTKSAANVPSTAAALALPCGYSSAVSLTQLAQGVSQARAALELASAHGGAIGPAGLISLEGLLEQQPAGRLEPFVDQLISPLLSSDSRRGTQHVATLRAFLRNDGSLFRTARDQYLHVNTVRHRLARVHQITGRDPLVFADRAALAIALWALDRHGPPTAPTHAGPTPGC